jgi:transposase
MTKTTTRNKQYNGDHAVLYLSLELGAAKWCLGFSTGLGQKPRRRTIEAGNTEIFQKEIAAAKKRFRLPQNTHVKSCYEAGRDGFWLHRYLTSVGVENIIIDSSSIEVKRKKRRAKTDRLDLEKMLLMLIRYSLGEKKVWSIVRPPSPEEEDRRQMHRELKSIKREATRTTNRIRGLLATQGIRISQSMDLEGEKLDAIRTWDGEPLREGLKNRLRREWKHVLFLKEQISELTAIRRKQHKEESEPDIKKIKQLSWFCGIGQESSWVLVRELFGWRSFQNRRELASLTGLTPTPYDSGSSIREQGISKSGNRHVRAIAIEMAWAWLRYQPDSSLTLWFNKRFADAGKRARKVGIVALARKLIIAFWKYLEWGLIPDGAKFKTQEMRIR